MSRYVQVGVMSQRDPVTREIVEQVPLYVDADYRPAPTMSESERKQLVKDLARRFREAVKAERHGEEAS